VAAAPAPARRPEAAGAALSAIRRLARRGRAPASIPAEVEYEDVARYEREGPRPLAPGAREVAGASSLRIAVVVPWLLEGSGGHNTILNLVRGLEGRGHDCSLWVHDPGGRHAGLSDAELTARVLEWFGGMRGPVRRGFEAWQGADVAMATGWQTVHRVLLLDGCRSRAYLVQDHESDFHPESAERRWAEETYRLGLHCITAGRWLRDLVTQSYGASASWFDLGVDHSVYRPQDVRRDDSSVLFYARTTTPRRAVPLGLLALAELRRRMPDVQIQLFGDPRRASGTFRDLGVLQREELALAYSRATSGLVLSMTNHSLIAQEMMACGLPCVELDTPSTRAAFGADPPLELAPFRILAVADALERLLRDNALREARRQAGLRFAGERTWARAAEQVEGGVREAVRTAAE
jgi:glycosyltransferase involved in cell wall biosynthesis